jgi:uncharacterized protein YyaL (SSP411 family)
LNKVVEDEFQAEDGGFFTTGKTHEVLLLRMRSSNDGAIPSGLAIQTMNLLRLSELTGRQDLAKAADAALASSGLAANRSPGAFSNLLLVLDSLWASPFEIVIAGAPGDESTQAMLRAIRGTYLPQRVVALVDERTDLKLMPVLAGKHAEQAARAFVCRNFTCQEPTESVAEMLKLLGATK